MPADKYCNLPMPMATHRIAATSLAIYILPHVAWLKECRNGKPVGSAISVLTTAFGCVLAVWGTVQSVEGMFAPPSGSNSSSGSA